MYAGFVGPGMLTAAVLGLHGTTSSIPSTDSIFEVINYVSKDEHHGVNGKYMVLTEITLPRRTLIIAAFLQEYYL